MRQWRVVYGETIPAWERKFPTKREAPEFANAQKKVGDVIFSVAKVVPEEGPRSLMAALNSIR